MCIPRILDKKSNVEQHTEPTTTVGKQSMDKNLTKSKNFHKNLRSENGHGVNTSNIQQGKGVGGSRKQQENWRKHTKLDYRTDVTVLMSGEMVMDTAAGHRYR